MRRESARREAAEEGEIFVTSNRIAGALSLCTAVMVVAAPAHAGFVDLGGGWQASWDDSLDGLVHIFSFGVVGDAVFIEKGAEFTGGPTNGVFSPIDIVFTQTSPNAVGSIVIDDEVITNSTGEDWLDFHLELVGDAATFDDVATANSGGPGPLRRRRAGRLQLVPRRRGRSAVDRRGHRQRGDLYAPRDADDSDSRLAGPAGHQRPDSHPAAADTTLAA